MSSYNNIRKIKYTKTPTDVVSLQEYIMFEDSHAKEKYVVFRFSNNVNQRLFELKFEVLQYNKDNELIEKSVVSHSDFVAEANDLFVPNAKLKINFECESLEVRLAEASFDRVVWRDGEFLDNSYRFEEYAETVTEVQPLKSKKEKQPKEKKKSKKEKKQYKLGFNIRNITKRNRAHFPAVFNVILCVIFTALIVLSMLYFKLSTGAFTVDEFVVKETSSGYVTIVDYNGTEENIEIPSMLGERYYVTKISKGAFSNLKFKSIEFKTQRELTIDSGAFRKCSQLQTVTGVDCNTVVVNENAFTDCEKLSTFNVPGAKLCEKCFNGTDNIKYLTFNRILSSNAEIKLLDLFVGLDKITLNELGIYDTSNIYDYELFIKGVTLR